MKKGTNKNVTKVDMFLQFLWPFIRRQLFLLNVNHSVAHFEVESQ